MRVSHSSISTFLGCPLKYKISRVLGVYPVEGKRAPMFGKAFHVALEWVWGGHPLDVAIGAWKGAARKAGLSMEDTLIGKALLVAYATRYTIDHSEDISIEEDFKVPIKGDVVLSGRMDIKTRDYVLDHKVVAKKITPTYINSLNRSSQAEAYLMAARDQGGQQTHVVWDVIRRPSLRRNLKTPMAEREYYKVNCKGGQKGDPKPGTYLDDESWEDYWGRLVQLIADSPDEYLKRVKIVKTQEELDARRYDIYAAGCLMSSAVKDGAFPRNEGNCDKWGGCEYIPICWQGVDPRQSDLYTIKPRKDK